MHLLEVHASLSISFMCLP